MVAFNGLFKEKAGQVFTFDKGKKPGYVAVERSPVSWIAQTRKPKDKDIENKGFF
jgi:hypothetical protein